jgi:hypothetical protein
LAEREKSPIGRAFTNNTALDPNAFPTVLLDRLNVDNQSGTRTIQGNGSTTLGVDVVFADPYFFISNITSLLIDVQDTSNNATPFNQTDPSDQVLGVIPSYSRVNGGRVNGAACTSGGQTETFINRSRCDLHQQADASSTFNPTVVPEPGALLAGNRPRCLGCEPSSQETGPEAT